MNAIASSKTYQAVDLSFQNATKKCIMEKILEIFVLRFCMFLVYAVLSLGNVYITPENQFEMKGFNVIKVSDTPTVEYSVVR